MDVIQKKNLIILSAILMNLAIGNGILYYAGSDPYSPNINYTLMLGMSIACIIVYLLVFRYADFQKHFVPKLAVISIMCCMVIILLGNAIAVTIESPGNLLATLMMGIFGNIVLLPVSIVLGLLNLFWFHKIKHLQPDPLHYPEG